MTFGRGILIFLVALIFSALLWSYVRLSSPYEADVDFPIKLTPPKGYALASGLPERLHARVRGAGWQILVMNFTKNANFQFDLSERAVLPNAPLVLHSDEIAHAVFMPSELRVLKVEPDSLKLVFSNAVEKRVAVEPRLYVTPGAGYVIVGLPHATPAFVTVVGAQDVLGSLTSVSTTDVAVSGAKEDVDRLIPLSDSLNNLISTGSTSKISVHVDIQAIAERTIAGIPVMIDGLPSQYEVLLIPGAVNVTLRGGVDALAKLPPASVRAHVLYDPLVFDTAHTILPHIEVPKGFAFLSADPPRLKFIIRRKLMPAHATL
jgi:hypothetical protein